MSDAALLVDAIRSGHLHTAIDSTAMPASFEFSASNRAGGAREGGGLPAGGPGTLRGRSNAPPEFVTNVWNAGSIVSPGHHLHDFTVVVPEAAGVYWVEIRPADRSAPGPWLTSNPIWIQEPSTPPAVARRTATRAQPIFDDKTTTGWRVEHDQTSLAAGDAASLTDGGEPRVTVGLARRAV